MSIVPGSFPVPVPAGLEGYETAGLSAPSSAEVMSPDGVVRPPKVRPNVPVAPETQATLKEKLPLLSTPTMVNVPELKVENVFEPEDCAVPVTVPKLALLELTVKLLAPPPLLSNTLPDVGFCPFVGTGVDPP